MYSLSTNQLVLSSVLFASAHGIAQMKIDQVTIINNCDSDIYFAQSNPSNAKIAAGDKWSGDWKVGHGNVAGRLAFSYFPSAFAHGAVGSNTPLDNVWVEIARGDISPGEMGTAGGFNFANQFGFVDLDLEVQALNGSELVCPDAKARTALDVAKCNDLGDGGHAQVLTKDGVSAKWCQSANYDSNTCWKSDAGRHACTNGYATYVSDNSMLWMPAGKSATNGKWLAQPRSTGNWAQDDKEDCPAQYADGFVGAASRNGRVTCKGPDGKDQNGINAVNFECWESCCKPDALGGVTAQQNAARVAQCEEVNGVTSGNAGFMVCTGMDMVHITNLQITTCPSRSVLSSDNVAMTTCPAQNLRALAATEHQSQCGPAVVKPQQNPKSWSPNPPVASVSFTSSVTSTAADETSSTTAAQTAADETSSTTAAQTAAEETSSTTAAQTAAEETSNSAPTEAQTNNGFGETSSIQV